MTIESLQQKTKKIYCRKCRQPTNHTVLHEVKTGWDDQESGMWLIDIFTTLQCLGCEAVCLLEDYVFSEDIDPYTGNPENQVSIHPNPFKDREELKEIYHLPEKIRKIYIETVSAFNQKLPILTGVGLRTIIEAICKDKKAVGKDLEARINALVNLGLITNNESELLHLNRYIGNISTHEVIEAPLEELKTGLDIIETALQNAYILPQKAVSLKAKYSKKKK